MTTMSTHGHRKKCFTIVSAIKQQQKKKRIEFCTKANSQHRDLLKYLFSSCSPSSSTEDKREKKKRTAADSIELQVLDRDSLGDVFARL